jgi:PEP-CTERM motif
MSSILFARPGQRQTAIAAAVLLCGAAAQAQVTDMAASFRYTVGAGGAVEEGRSTLPRNPVDAFVQDTVGPNSAFTHSFGSTTGNFGSRSSGVGIYDVAGAFKIVQTVTNTSSEAQSAKFNFYISPGLLANNLGSAALKGDESIKAGLGFDVRRDGTQIWGSTGLLQTKVGSATAFSTTGDNSLYSGSGSQIVIRGVNKSVDLGVINAGESITLSYELTSFAQGHSSPSGERIVPEMTYTIPDTWVNVTCGGGYGYGGGYGCIPGPQLRPGYTFTVPGYTIYDTPSSSFSGAGDPFTIDFYGNPKYTTNGVLPPGVMQGISWSAVAAVPEPGTWALMLAGMVGVGALARRRRQAKSAAQLSAG